jgi:lipopolysaccharide biosynthesis protein
MSQLKRLCIFFFYDEDGIVDDYVLFLLNSLRQYCVEIAVVVNGNISEEGRDKLQAVSDVFLQRENVGLDAYAYKYAIEQHYGYDGIKKFDELLVTNFTIFGPLFSLDELFFAMEKRDCDFWGLTGHLEDGGELKPRVHLQSYFVCYGKKLLQSEVFSEYWATLPEIKNYEDSVQSHELRQTPFFEKFGFKFDSYVPILKYTYLMPHNSVIYAAERQLVEDKNPFIKRRYFYYDNPPVPLEKQRYVAQYIKNMTSYNIKNIHDNLRRTQFKEKKSFLPFLSHSDIQKAKFTILSRIHFLRRKRQHYRKRLKSIHQEMNHITYLACFCADRSDIAELKVFSPNLYHIGRNTYSQPDIVIQSQYSAIGAFCSIGHRCVFGHGEHPIDYLSTSPYFYFDELKYKNKNMTFHDEYWFNAPIIIGNDVWIGDGVFIKNGIKVGDGAIIGARSIVTKDVPPYAIVAGSPAKIIRYRFSDDVIEKLLDLRWWDLPDSIIKQIPYENIDEAIVFIENYREKLCAA